MKQSFGDIKKHNSAVAGIALIIYLLLITLIVLSVVEYYGRIKNPPIVIQIFIIFVSVVFIIFNYPQILSLCITVWGLFRRGKAFKFYDKITKTTIISCNPKVAILYVTKDDFIPQALDTALNQKYKNYDVYILDDSADKKYINYIDEYKKMHNSVFVIRRNGVGPKNKAGNINHFIETNKIHYDNIAIMDADTYLSNNFLSDGLKFFEKFNDVGVVQATNNCIVNCENVFQDICAPSYSSNRLHGATEGAIIDQALSTLCTGHACIFLMEAINKIGGKFPPYISEDYSITIELRKQNYGVMYACSVVCYEETPPNYVAGKKRILRWQTGAFDFSIKYTGKIIASKFRWSEKLYILNACYNGWITPIFSVLSTILAFSMCFPISSNNMSVGDLPGVAGVFSIIFMILSFVSVSGKAMISKTKFSQTLKSMFGTALIGSSMLPSLFVQAITLPFVKRKFKVTIKQNQRFNGYDTFKYNGIDILGGTLLFAYMISVVCITKVGYFILNPFLWVTFASYISLFFVCTGSNKPLKEVRNTEGFKKS